jgi:hypothetical protein
MTIARNSRSPRDEWIFQPWPRRNAAFACWDGSALVNARAARSSASWKRGPVLILLMTVCATILAGAAVAQLFADDDPWRDGPTASLHADDQGAGAKDDHIAELLVEHRHAVLGH